MVFVVYKNPKLFPVNLILTAVSRYTLINTSAIYNRTHALFAAQMTHATASYDVPDNSYSVIGCSRQLIQRHRMFQTTPHLIISDIIDFLYHFCCA